MPRPSSPPQLPLDRIPDHVQDGLPTQVQPPPPPPVTLTQYHGLENSEVYLNLEGSTLFTNDLTWETMYPPEWEVLNPNDIRFSFDFSTGVLSARAEGAGEIVVLDDFSVNNYAAIGDLDQFSFSATGYDANVEAGDTYLVHTDQDQYYAIGNVSFTATHFSYDYILLA